MLGYKPLSNDRQVDLDCGAKGQGGTRSTAMRFAVGNGQGSRAITFGPAFRGASR